MPIAWHVNHFPLDYGSLEKTNKRYAKYSKNVRKIVNPEVSPGRHVRYLGRRRGAVGSRDCCSEPGPSAPLHEKPPEKN